MAPLPPWLLWPLRKAAAIPMIALGGLVAGAAAGSFIGTRRLLYGVIGRPVAPQSNGTDASGRSGVRGASSAALSAAGVVGAVVVGVRERMAAGSFQHTKPPVQVVDTAPLAARLRTAMIVMLHYVVHYPYAHRFTSVVAAGAAAALAYVGTERAVYAAARSKRQPAPAAAPAPGLDAITDEPTDAQPAAAVQDATQGAEMTESPRDAAADERDSRVDAGRGSDRFARELTDTRTQAHESDALASDSSTGMTYDADPYEKKSE